MESESLSVATLEDDPFLAASRRTSVATAGVDIFVFDAGNPERAELVGAGLVSTLRELGRKSELHMLPSWSPEGMGPTLESAIRVTSQDLILVTTAILPWNREHLQPLLEVIEAADHAVGCRPATWPERLKRYLGRSIRSTLYGVPVLDLHSPCTIHRRSSLETIPLQSESAFVQLEILAKATFLSRLLVEVRVPDLEADDDTRRMALWRHDRADLWRKPRFRHSVSGPAEVPQRQDEGDDSPGHQDE